MRTERIPDKQKGVVWNNSLIGDPVYMLGAAGFALYSTLTLSIYATSRLIQKLRK